jgi:FlaA1/EpsC-like NDP-sugar epimerase
MATLTHQIDPATPRLQVEAPRIRDELAGDERGAGAQLDTILPPGARAVARQWVDRVVGGLRRYSLASIALVHVSIFSVAFLLATLIRFDGAITPQQWSLSLSFLPALVMLKLGTFFLLGDHRGWCRYNTFADMVGVGRAATLGTLLVIGASRLSTSWLAIPRSILAIDWAGTIVLIVGIRGSIRLFRERHYPRLTHAPVRPVLIVGASESGVALARQIRSQPGLGMRVAGFLDADPSLRGQLLAGTRIRGVPSDVTRLARRLEVKTVLIPTSSVPPHQIREIVGACSGMGMGVQIVPGFDALLSGDVVVKPRDVDIHDLLYREPIRLDCDSVSRLLRDQVVLVTGAAGSIGSELCRQLLTFRPRRLILLDHSENGLFYIERELRELAGVDVEVVPTVAGITNAPRLRTIFQAFRPAVVYHAAAHKHVPMMESNPGEAVRNNVFGTRTLVDEAVHAGVEALVMISTDKAVNPTSVMGVCKRAAEMYVQALSGRVSTRLMTVRFGNVLGSSGSVVPLFKQQIDRGGPITVTHPEMTRFFMTIPEASQLVLQASAQGAGGEIFVLDMGQPVRILDLARDLIRLSGLHEGRDIEIIFTGLRPGEKLYEELYHAGEIRLPTPHPKIFAALHRPCSLEHVEAELNNLARFVDDPDGGLLAALTELVSEYQPGGAMHSPVRKDGEDDRRRRKGDRQLKTVLATEKSK